MIRVLALYFLMASMALAAEVAPSQCRDAGAGDAGLVPAELLPWKKYEHVVQLCPAYATDGSLAWWLAILRLDQCDNDEFDDRALHPLNPDGFTYRGYPKPYILTENGKVLGRLSSSFPFLVPGVVTVKLSNWHGNLPYRIDIHAENAAVDGSYDAPSLQWNEKTHHYDQIGTGIRNQRQ